ncbi:SRPBCC domain-containing protein [Jatrophihabitans sp. DSM 45814]
MQLEHAFTVPVPIEQAWEALLDIEQVAPCMPGAALETVDGDDFTGSVKVRLGPIGLTYKGKASFVEKDIAAHRAVIDAQGKDARGNGTAAAKVTATLVAEGQSTKVAVTTDLNITGKPAQFGRGVMVDVGNKLIGQFADCLAGKLAGSTDAGSAAEPASEPATVPAAEPVATTSAPAAENAQTEPARQPPRPVRQATAEVEPIDLLGSAGPAVAKRLIPLALPLLLVVLVVLRRRRAR